MRRGNARKTTTTQAPATLLALAYRGKGMDKEWAEIW
jgi:hypothetical protein